MKKKVITIVFLLLTAVTIGCSIINDEKSVGIKGVNFFDPEFPIQVEQLKPGDIIDEFDAIVATIDKWFALKERKNIASDLLNQHFRERMSQASDKDQLLEILTEMFATLDNGHSRLFESRTNGLARATIIEDNFVITSMAETSALVKHEVQVGWLITQIDDMPIRQWINLQQKYFGGSDQWVRRNLEYHVFMRFPFQAEERTYTLLDEQGAEHNVTIPLQNSFSEFMDACLPQEMVISERMEIEGYIFGYISIHEMSHLALAEFDKHLAKLLDANGIIIDLRNNSGGSSAVGDAIFSRLIHKPTHGWVTVADNMPPHLPYENPNYKGPIVVLVGYQTFSAAESFVYDLYDSGRATLVGGITGGDSGCGPRAFITDRGFGFTLPTRGVDKSVSGMEMEGTGLVPHVEVYPTLDDYYRGYDGVLNTGIQQLQRVIQK